MPKNHTYVADELVLGVLDSKPVTALCGYIKQHTRDEFGTWGDKTCTDCLKLMAPEPDGTHKFLPPMSWAEMLEAYIARHRKPARTISVNYVASWRFPLAG